MLPGHTARAGTLCSEPPEGDVGARPAAEGAVGVEPAPLALSCGKSTIKWRGVKGMEGSEDVSPLAEPTALLPGAIPSGMQSAASSKEHGEGLCSISTALNGEQRRPLYVSKLNQKAKLFTESRRCNPKRVHREIQPALEAASIGKLDPGLLFLQQGALECK